jgi:hypothetical protein
MPVKTVVKAIAEGDLTSLSELTCIIRPPNSFCLNQAKFFYYDPILNEIFGYCEEHDRVPVPPIRPMSTQEIMVYSEITFNYAANQRTVKYGGFR